MTKTTSADAMEMAMIVAMLRDSFHITTSWAEQDVNEEKDLQHEIRANLKPNKLSSGCYRTAVIFDDFVIKFPRDHRVTEMRDEYNFIRKMRNTDWARHFPETQLVEIGHTVVLIQEKVNMSHRGRSGFELYAAARLGEFLGISDMHDGNFGWKGPKGREYPVFVDVDIRRGYAIPSKKQIRSWMVG